MRLIPSNDPAKFHWNDQNILGEKYKNVIFSIENGRHFVEDCAIGQKFCNALPDHPRYMYTKYHEDLFNNKGSRAGTKIRQHILDEAAAAASTLSKYIGPTLHVGHTNTVSEVENQVNFTFDAVFF